MDILNLSADAQHWFCPPCRNNMSSFNSAGIQDILSNNFNSNLLCPCKDLTKGLTDYECLETITELKLSKLDLNQFHPYADNDIDHNLNINSDFKYYTTHQFNKLSRIMNDEKQHSLVLCTQIYAL